MGIEINEPCSRTLKGHSMPTHTVVPRWPSQISNIAILLVVEWSCAMCQNSIPDSFGDMIV